MDLIFSKILLILYFSLIFSLTLLCSIFFLRTKDRLVSRLLIILYPLFLHGFTCLIYYVFPDILKSMQTGSAFSLFLLLLSCITLPLILYAISHYLLYLVTDKPKGLRLGGWLIKGYSLAFFFISLYFMLYLNSQNWMDALTRALNELFLYGSMFLIIPAIVASVYLGRLKDSGKKQLLRGIVISFYPIGVFAALDLFFFMESPYKLVYISYVIFAILVFLYVGRHFVYKYQPEIPDLPEPDDDIYRLWDISEREQELISLLVKGHTNREISELLFISYNTVKTHVQNIYRKMGVSNRLQLLAKLRTNPEG